MGAGTRTAGPAWEELGTWAVGWGCLWRWEEVFAEDCKENWVEGRKEERLGCQKVMPSGARGTDPLLGRDIIWAFAKGLGRWEGGRWAQESGGKSPGQKGEGSCPPSRTQEPGWGPTPSEALWDPGSAARPFAAGGQPSPELGAGSAG